MTKQPIFNHNPDIGEFYDIRDPWEILLRWHKTMEEFEVKNTKERMEV